MHIASTGSKRLGSFLGHEPNSLELADLTGGQVVRKINSLWSGLRADAVSAIPTGKTSGGFQSQCR